MITKETIDARIQKGVRFLNRNYPKWYKTIVLKEFDFNDPCRCVVGFIMRQNKTDCSYRSFLDFHSQHPGVDPFKLGFDWHWEENGMPTDDQIRYMQEAWVKEIKKARAEAKKVA